MLIQSFVLCAARVDQLHHGRQASKLLSCLASFFCVKIYVIILPGFCDIRYPTGVGNLTLNCKICPQVKWVGNEY
jgi:hypothetical protein